MNVLLVTNMYPFKERPYYGIFVKEQENALRKEFRDIKISVFFIDRRLGLKEYIKSIFKIHRLIETEQIDLVHVHYGFSGLFLLKPMKKKIPVVVTLHGGDIQIEQGKKIQVFLTKKILGKADFAITLNDKMDCIVKKYIKNTCIIPCSVNTDIFKPMQRELLDTKQIVFPSYKEYYIKNFPLFDRTIHILQNKYHVKCKTTEIKNMSRMEVAELFANSDLMLMTSLSEGSPQVVKEAMACNLPVVSTDVGDVKNLLFNVSNSYVAENFDAEELARLCFVSLKNEGSGVTGREKIVQMGLDDRTTAGKIYSIYNTLISKKA